MTAPTSDDGSDTDPTDQATDATTTDEATDASESTTDAPPGRPIESVEGGTQEPIDGP